MMDKQKQEKILRFSPSKVPLNFRRAFIWLFVLVCLAGLLDSLLTTFNFMHGLSGLELNPLVFPSNWVPLLQKAFLLVLLFVFFSWYFKLSQDSKLPKLSQVKHSFFLFSWLILLILGQLFAAYSNFENARFANFYKGVDAGTEQIIETNTTIYYVTPEVTYTYAKLSIPEKIRSYAVSDFEVFFYPIIVSWLSWLLVEKTILRV
jgi:hypothetical protein